MKNMRARTTFTLLIALAAFVAVFFYSSHIFSELKEEVYELIDIELEQTADGIFESLQKGNFRLSQNALASVETFLSEYWIRVSDSAGNILFATPLAEAVDLPQPNPQKKGKAYMVTIPIALELLHIPESEKEDIKPGPIDLRVMEFHHQIDDLPVIIHIAKPMHLIQFEFKEIFLETWSSVLLTILVIIVLSYLVAGRILQPLVDINRQIARIREQSLNERIPSRSSRDEFDVLISSLNSMFDRLEHSFARQRDFINNAAHEMKSPLTILMLDHEEMLSSSLNPEIRLALERQLQTMRRLNKLVRDLLSIARLEQEDKLTREPIELAGLLTRIVEDYQEMIAAKKITVHLALSPVQAQVDREKIQRLFINLIDNAIKYNCPHQGMLRIEIETRQQFVAVLVVNSGTTIPQQDLKQIFKQFYRVEKSRSQTFGGTGLGLTIALRIAEMHGGDITVSSQDHSTTFTVLLPYSGSPH